MPGSWANVWESWPVSTGQLQRLFNDKPVCIDHHNNMSRNLRPNFSDLVLATDLDGTLIPLAEHPQNRTDLQRLAELVRSHRVTLTYVTGRHLASVQHARSEHDLPRPDWIICDVGTTIYQLDQQGQPQEVAAYGEHLETLIAAFPIADLRESLRDLPELRLQEEEKQGRFKLSYYADAGRLKPLVAELEHRLETHDAPYSLIASIDPYDGDGLIDFLPRQVSKAYALKWWCEFAKYERRSIVFAGDSGNDTAALTAGFRAIVVANADRNVALEAYHHHKERGWENRLVVAGAPATSGLLEGCLRFRLFRDARMEMLENLPLPVGANPLDFHRTHFRVWAPQHESLEVEIQNDIGTRSYALAREADGYFAGIIDDVSPGDLYRYRLDGGMLLPDPVSRFQPHGVHGESQVIDPRSFPWTDQHWEGVRKRDLVIYELHIGAFTPEGTFLAAIEKLDELTELGITAVEVMPVVQTPGRWNWGYDGVDLFAVRNTYGNPDDFKAFIDACHARGLAVILDVVYNHVGPEGNYWAKFAPYYSPKHHTPWGEAFDFDGSEAAHVRRFVVENALYWLREYHLDGLRLDAVHSMADDSPVHVLEDIRAAVAEFKKDTRRQMHLIAEANIYDPVLLPPEQNRPAYDALWCDDIMHSIYAAIAPGVHVTHRDYTGPGDLAESLRHGFLYEGPPERRMNDELRSNRPSDPVNAFRSDFVIALQNHDNVGNHPHGLRVHQLTSPAHQKAAAALILLYPAIPLLFMGEEHAEASPFRFFADFEDEHLRRAVDQGRANEYPHHEWSGAISPTDERAFQESKLAGSDDPTMRGWYRSLLKLRKEWLEQEILEPERLSTIWQPAAHLFGLKYRGAEGSELVRAFAADTHSHIPIPHSRASGGKSAVGFRPTQSARSGQAHRDPNAPRTDRPRHISLLGEP